MTAPVLGRRAALGLAAAALPFRARAQPAVLRIGVLNDMSGAYRDGSGMTSVACVRQAVEEFGDHGFAVEVLLGDHQNKPDIGLGIARQWFDRDGVDLIIDVPTSSVALAVNALAKDRNKAYVNCSAGTIDLTGKDCTPNIVHWGYDTTMLATMIGRAVTERGGKKWFFLTADYVFGHQLQDEAERVVQRAGGTVLGAARYPFPSTTDFSGLLVQAQASGATVIGLANAGDDTVNCVKQAHEFGLADSGIEIAALLSNITSVHSIGTGIGQGLLQTESFYWDLNDGTRAFTRRVVPETPKNWPNAVHASNYAATRHFLKVVAALGIGSKDDGAALIAGMKAMPAEDECFGRTVIRADGRAMLRPYLMRVKRPSESKSEWDLLEIVSSLPADETAPPVGICPLVRN